MRPPGAASAMRLEEVDTPALILDLDAFERNLQHACRHGARRACACARTPRPASRAEVGKRQMALGAVGVCCQKVAEAEAMVEGGIADVLVSNEVVGAAKLERLAQLARRARIGVCVDDAGNVRDLDAAAQARRREARRLRRAGSRHGPLRRRAGRAGAGARARGGGLRQPALRRPAGLQRPRAARALDRGPARAHRQGRRGGAHDARAAGARTASLAPSSPARAAAPSCSKWNPAPGTRSSRAPMPSWTRTTRGTNGRRRCRASSTRSSSSPR